MRVLILEDHDKTREMIKKIVKACASDCEIFDFATRVDAYLCAMENTIDLFLVDIILDPTKKNDNSGIIFADSLRQNSKYKLTPIIFITTLLGMETEMLKRIHCYDYIEKPIGDGQIVKRHIEEVVEAIRSSNAPKKPEYIPLRHDGIGYVVYLDKVVYFTSKRGVLHIQLTDDVIEIPNMSAMTLLKEIKETTFLIPTYGTAINPRHIESIDFRNKEVYMKGIQEVIPIGGRKFKSFREAYLGWHG